MNRVPRAFPKLLIKRKIDNIENFIADDFELIGYNPHGKIEMKMAV